MATGQCHLQEASSCRHSKARARLLGGTTRVLGRQSPGTGKATPAPACEQDSPRRFPPERTRAPTPSLCPGTELRASPGPPVEPGVALGGRPHTPVTARYKTPRPQRTSSPPRRARRNPGPRLSRRHCLAGHPPHNPLCAAHPPNSPHGDRERTGGHQGGGLLGQLSVGLDGG